MRNIIFLLLLSACSDETLVAPKKCGAPCAIVDGGVLLNEEALEATCRPGTSTCDEEENPSCPDYIPPEAQELCGGLDDDDCNPETKESDIFIPPGGNSNTCSVTEKGVCRRSGMICFGGEMICDNRLKSTEVCDTGMQDEDCDGLINSADDDMAFTIPLYRYDGDASTANVGACRIGVARCIGGNQVYDGMVLPRAEECGNNIDDDCDGLTDEPTGDVSPRSFLLLIDYSGSMTDYVDNVEQALCDWSINRPGDYFGIGGFGVEEYNDSFQYREILPFSPATVACNTMMSTNPLAGGTEYAAKAGLLYLEDNTWPTTDRNVIIFSDEESQSFSQQDVPSLVQECSQSSLQLGIYTMPSVEETYYELVDGCYGWIEYLSSSRNMTASLTAKFAGVCTQ